MRQIIADIIGITDIVSQRYRYMAHHHSLAIRQAIWKLPDVTHFPSPFYGPVHACLSAQRAINNIYRSSTSHEYAKHAFYDTWTQVYRRLFYNLQSFDVLPQGTLANIPNVPYISRNYLHFPTDSLCLSSLNFF